MVSLSKTGGVEEQVLKILSKANVPLMFPCKKRCPVPLAPYTAGPLYRHYPPQYRPHAVVPAPPWCTTAQQRVNSQSWGAGPMNNTSSTAPLMPAPRPPQPFWMMALSPVALWRGMW